MGKDDLSDKEKLFRTQIGQRATIQRETVTNDDSAKANRRLADLGIDLNPLTENLQYMGSAAVHIYWNDTLQQVFFLSQSALLDTYKCPEALAARAFDDLLGDMKQRYGHRRSRLRSGF